MTQWKYVRPTTVEEARALWIKAEADRNAARPEARRVAQAFRELCDIEEITRGDLDRLAGVPHDRR